MKRLLVLLFFCFQISAFAQRDTVLLSPQERDTVVLNSYAQRYNPKKALLYAAVLPGLGQVYTKKYWKLPLVYGGIIATGYAINFYQDGYQLYRGELFYNLENGIGESGFNPNTGFTTAQLRTITDRYRRERDFMIIVMIGVYVLQMIDAHVDAHLKEFDLNPNLHVRIEPAFRNEMLTGQTGGLSLKLRF
ncbi:MAG: hypothetical protein KF846_04150 [Cyclobacteriaceae bacterium]|nr:hypothetical protein [Cyclobacteriaceae bacterium]